MRVFGRKEVPEGRYVERPGAYAVVIASDGSEPLVATVVGSGQFLPGGGLEPGENLTDALLREVREETGLLVRPISVLGEAAECLYAGTEQTYFKKVGTFFLAEFRLDQTGNEHAEHEVVWLPAKRASLHLAHDSHAWAVDEALAVLGQ